MKSEEYLRKLHHLEWLKSIEKEYRNHSAQIKKESSTVTIQSISYTTRGDAVRISINPHRPIPARYIYGGLVDALDRLVEEITELEKELKSVMVEL